MLSSQKPQLGADTPEVLVPSLLLAARTIPIVLLSQDMSGNGSLTGLQDRFDISVTPSFVSLSNTRCGTGV